MLTAIGAWIAAVALWTIWALAVALTTTIVGAIFYWLLTDNDDPQLASGLGHGPGNWDARVPVSGTRRSSSFRGLRPAAVYEWCTNTGDDSAVAESGRGFRTVVEPRHRDARHNAEMAGGGLLA